MVKCTDTGATPSWPSTIAVPAAVDGHLSGAHWRWTLPIIYGTQSCARPVTPSTHDDVVRHHKQDLCAPRDSAGVMPPHFDTKQLPAAVDAIASDGSDARILLRLPEGTFAHF
jgi:hypothetical protein